MKHSGARCNGVWMLCWWHCLEAISCLWELCHQEGERWSTESDDLASNLGPHDLKWAEIVWVRLDHGMKKSNQQAPRMCDNSSKTAGKALQVTTLQIWLRECTHLKCKNISCYVQTSYRMRMPLLMTLNQKYRQHWIKRWVQMFNSCCVEKWNTISMSLCSTLMWK